MKLEGSCCCGAVKFTVDAYAPAPYMRCYCSICRKSGLLHLIVTKERFRLRTDEAALAEYRFGTGTARHLFCRTCGIKSFYVPRSHPDGIDVNARCLDPATVLALRIRPYDGQNWEAARAGID